MTEQPNDLIQRADGSYVSLSNLPVRDQLSHDLVERLFPLALEQRASLQNLKENGLKELRAFRDMMLNDYETKIEGGEGGFSIKSACGTKRISLEVSKTIEFGPEIEAAKALLDEFMSSELDGSSDAIRAIVGDVFKLKTNARLDRAGILGLKKHPFTQPLWLRAMKAIDDAIDRDAASTTYLRFYEINTEMNLQDMVMLNISKV